MLVNHSHKYEFLSPKDRYHGLQEAMSKIRVTGSLTINLHLPMQYQWGLGEVGTIVE